MAPSDRSRRAERPPREQLALDLRARPSAGEAGRRRPLPDTSHAAARATTRQQSRRETLKVAVVREIDAQPGPVGLTATELHAALGAAYGVDLQEIRRRLSDLRREGVLELGERRGCTALGASEAAYIIARSRLLDTATWYRDAAARRAP